MLGHVKVTRQDGLASKGEWERKRVRVKDAVLWYEEPEESEETLCI